MKLKPILLIGLIFIVLTGCSSVFSPNETDSAQSADYLRVGHSLEINGIDARFNLIDNNSVLAADGLYYVSWGMGETKPYENADGETVDLYDASLYLLLGESKNHESAQSNMNTWYEAALSNYEVLEEEEVTVNDQTYTLITYNSTGDGPNARGASAFGVIGSNAVCIELTCCENFNEDLKAILTDFLGTLSE